MCLENNKVKFHGSLGLLFFLYVLSQSCFFPKAKKVLVWQKIVDSPSHKVQNFAPNNSHLSCYMCVPTYFLNTAEPFEWDLELGNQRRAVDNPAYWSDMPRFWDFALYNRLGACVMKIKLKKQSETKTKKKHLKDSCKWFIKACEFLQ